MVIDVLALNARVIQLIVESAQVRVNRQPTIFNSFFVQNKQSRFRIYKKTLTFFISYLVFCILSYYKRMI